MVFYHLPLGIVKFVPPGGKMRTLCDSPGTPTELKSVTGTLLLPTGGLTKVGVKYAYTSENLEPIPIRNYYQK